MASKIEIIERFGNGDAIGKLVDGRRLLVLGGNLSPAPFCEVIVKEKHAILYQLDYNLSEVIALHSDKDGLVSLSQLTEQQFSNSRLRMYEIDSKLCFPSYECSGLLESAYKWSLEKLCRIKISTAYYSAIAAQKIYGVNFYQAIKDCLKKGVSRSYHYSIERKNYEDGVLADFLIRLTKDKDGNIVLNAWQAIGKEERLFFVHAIFDKSAGTIQHIDCAYHYTSISSIHSFFSNPKENPVLRYKEKVFRIDGTINTEFGLQLMKLFFPLDELVEEYTTR